jgi:hypothetical protein
LCEGKFLEADKLRTDGGGGGLYLCFDFRRFKGCKLLIGSFSQYCPYGGIWMVLFIERSIHAVDKFRYNDEEGEEISCGFGKYLVGIYDKGGKDGEWVELTASYPEKGEYPELNNFDGLPEDTWLFLDVPDFIEPCRQNYQEVARVMGERAKYWFEHGHIREGATSLTIIKFLEEYIGNEKEE